MATFASVRLLLTDVTSCNWPAGRLVPPQREAVHVQSPSWRCDVSSHCTAQRLSPAPSQGVPPPCRGAALPVAQARERSVAPTAEAVVRVASSPAARLRSTHLRRGEAGVAGNPRRACGNQRVGSREPRRGLRGVADATSPGSVRPDRSFAEDDEHPGVGQLPRRRSVGVGSITGRNRIRSSVGWQRLFWTSSRAYGG